SASSMTDPVLLLIVIAVFFIVTAGAHYFKTLAADVWHAWRTPLAAGLVAGVILWPFHAQEIVAGIVLSAAALYVRLTGRESESIDGMLLGGCSGAAAAAVLIWRPGIAPVVIA